MNLLSAEIIETPIGHMQAVASPRGLCALEFVTPARQQLLKARLNKWFATERLEWRSHSVINDARRWLQSYFNGRFSELFEFAVDLRGTPLRYRSGRSCVASRSDERYLIQNSQRRSETPRGPERSAGPRGGIPCRLLFPAIG